MKHGCRSLKAQGHLRSLCVDANLKGKTMVEIGSYAGESTVVFARFCNKVYAIDPWSESWKTDESTENMKLIEATAPYYLNAPMSEVEQCFDERTSNFGNIIKIKDYSDNAISQFADDSIDAVYIDSIHTYEATKRSIILWKPKIKSIIAGHDYYPPKWPGVVQAVIVGLFFFRIF